MNGRQINVFAFITETNVRFVFLITLALTHLWALGSLLLSAWNEQRSHDYATLYYEPFQQTTPLETLERELRESTNSISPSLQEKLTFYWAIFQYATTNLILGVLFSSLLLAAATIFYWLMPAAIRFRRKLQLMTTHEDPLLDSTIGSIAQKMGLHIMPTLEKSGPILVASAQVFGRRPPYTLRISRGMQLLLRKNIDSFTAIVSHELAHIVNSDIFQTYFGLAIWLVTILGTIVPSLIVRVQRELEGRIFEEPVLWFILRPLSMLIVLLMISRSLLRAREVLADWKAAFYFSERPLIDILRRHTPKTNPLWRRLWRLHPSPSERLQALFRPEILMHSRYEVAFIAGTLTGYILLAIIAGSSDYSLSIGSGLRLAEHIMLLIIVRLSDFFGLSYPSILPAYAQLASSLIPRFLLYMIYVLPALLIAYTVGVEIQRESVSSMPRPRHRFVKLPLMAFLLACGIEFGFMTSPLAIFYNTGTVGANIVWIPSNLGILTFTSWLWLSSLDFYSAWILRSHYKTEIPRVKQHLITLISAVPIAIFFMPYSSLRILLTGVYLSGVTERLFGMTINFEEYLTYEAFGNFVLAIVGLILFLSIMAILSLVIFISRKLTNNHCATCGWTWRGPSRFGQYCKQCGSPLLPWLYVKPERQPEIYRESIQHAQTQERSKTVVKIGVAIGIIASLVILNAIFCSNTVPRPPWFGAGCNTFSVGPHGIEAGGFDPTSLSQDQRQWLFEVFGHDGIAPVGYGGETCP